MELHFYHQKSIQTLFYRMDDLQNGLLDTILW